MKKMIISLAMLTISASCFSQQTEPMKPRTPLEYLKKSKYQKTAAWVLTAAGTTGLLGTWIADGSQTVAGAFITLLTLGTAEPEYKSYTGAYLLSAATVAGGIILFVAASKNKKRAKAASAYFKIEKASFLQLASITNLSYPSVGITISL
ncbi:MAG: hypothetical protein ABIN57_11830 [Chitinophagaceae bacterium]